MTRGISPRRLTISATPWCPCRTRIVTGSMNGSSSRNSAERKTAMLKLATGSERQALGGFFFMAHIRCPDPVLLIVAAFSKHIEVLEDAGRRLQEVLGPIALASLPYAFTQTDYYEATMGRGLQKLFFVFQNLVPTENLGSIKNQTNEIESALAQSGAFAETRP